MADREKAMRGLECCYDDNCGACPYSASKKCQHELHSDALALLKEQEPKMVVQTTSTIRCPGCGKQITSKGALHKDIKYCWKCGQEVKWE